MNEDAISILGLGYVGLTLAVCFAHKGLKVVGFDVDPEKVRMINGGRSPFYEPGLEVLLGEASKKSLLSCTDNSSEALRDTAISFITVGTPSNPDGSIDLKFVKSASEIIGRGLEPKGSYHLVVVKSTVIPGTTERLVKTSIEKFSHKGCGDGFGLCVNPEFIGEGSALQDTLDPDRLVIGEHDEESGDVLEAFYEKFHAPNIPPIVRTNLQNAELIKYASNAFLAMKVSFIDQMANLCERIPDSDVEVVARGVGLDRRVGPGFLKAGLGWGGSCFPKDLRALLRFSRSKGVPLPLTEATLTINEAQPSRAVEIAEKLMVDLNGKKVAILGLSFKPGTDDMRSAVSTKVIDELLRRGTSIAVYDPAAMENAKKILGDRVEYCGSALECLIGADCAIMVTEWPELSELRPEDFISQMRRPVVIDGRRLYDPEEFSQRLRYAAIDLGP